MRRALEVQLFLILNNPSFRLLESTDDPVGSEADRFQERLRGLGEQLAAAERSAEELYALGFRQSIGGVLNNSVAGAHYAIKRPVEDLGDEPQWSTIRKGLYEADIHLDISLELCRPRWRLKYWRGRSGEDAFRLARINEVTEKRRKFLDKKFREHYRRLDDGGADDELRNFLGTD
ncbi:hypothetical protein AB0383_07140 [Amycolatopsis sp. NPDC051373]|uniref:hypothetical protein n=1 Tax=Amycolatopsis sp. NPDC051373 TaxID=3155801 RepID=UPI00344B3EAD